jgi:hypothetical protein
VLPAADENERALRDESGTGEGYLYRYRDLVGERAGWVRQILVDSMLYFASPATFNDPFDCRVVFRKDISPEEFRNKADRLLAARGVARDERRRMLKPNRSPEEFIRNVTGGLQAKVDGVGVLSLSSTHENILMWSHYACGHRGVCLQFRVATEPHFLAGALPVKYSSELLVPPLFEDSSGHERVEQLLLTKAEDWSYEREWRALTGEQGPGARKFPPSLLTAMILGSSISPSDRDNVLEWARSRKAPLEIYEASRHAERYGLQFIRLD